VLTGEPDQTWPVSFADLFDAARRIRPHLQRTPVRRYAPLDAVVGAGIEVVVKHENVHPTNSFKVRNNVSAVTALSVKERARGVIAATRGNHGQGLAYAGRLVGAPVTVCVPEGNNPEKNEAMRGWGAEVIEQGADYDASVGVAERLTRERGLTMVHSTNDRTVIAGAGTLTVELLEDEPELDALVVAVGGGSQAVGALVAARTLCPRLAVYGVQAERAAAIHDSFHAGHPISKLSADTFADGLATRNAYPMTFPALKAGLADFVTVSEAELAEAVRILLRTTHHLVEGAGAAGLAGLIKLRSRLAGKRVAIVLSGGNIDERTLLKILNRDL
jgi:threonine dehydratase